MPIRRISRKSPGVTSLEVRQRTGIEQRDSIIVGQEDGGIIISKAEPRVWLEQMRALRADYWNGYAETLQRDRDEWDQRH